MRRKTLVARLYDADERSTNEAIRNLAEVTPVGILKSLAEVEYENDWAAGVKSLFDPQDFWNWTEGSVR